MSNNIQVSSQALVDTAEKIRAINKNMDEKLVEINRTMNALESSWKSEGSDTIRQAMNALKPRFEEYKAVVDSYAKFLVNTANEYESTETAVQTNAAAFK